MATHSDAMVPSTRRARKSTGHSPVRKRMDKENITVDVASSLAGNHSVHGGRKKLRSKSMGPGGLDVLKSGSGNRRVSLAAPNRPPPRSILKPTMPLLPEIPSYKSQGRKGGQAQVQGAENLPNPFHNGDSDSTVTKIAVRTEEEQQAAAREREEKERAAIEKEINDRREARRKSLANRRVSFAAEATLHTFHEVEYMQDSTTSTDSSRRVSESPVRTPASPEASDPPSTPPEQVEDLVPESPEPQRDLHQKKRRRSSALSFTNHDDNTQASSVFSSDSEATDATGMIETHEEINTDTSSDSDADGTTMDLEVDEVTGTSIASGRSTATDDSHDSTLDEALRLAQRQAETQNLDLEEEEVIPSFGWIKRSAPSPARDTDDGMEMDMDMTSAVGGILQSSEVGDENEELSMDVTKALGSILPQRRKSVGRRSASPKKTNEDSSLEETSMDLTIPIGGIRKSRQSEGDLLDLESNGDEDMSMELTAVMGGLLSSRKSISGARKSLPTRRRTLTSQSGESPMDITVGLGRILPSGEPGDAQEDTSMGMDMTTVVGGIVKAPSPTRGTPQSKGKGQEPGTAESSPFLESSASKGRLTAAVGVTNASETGSPGLSAFRGKGLRRSADRRASSVSKSASPTRTPSPPKAASPAAAQTPQETQPSTPLRTPPSKKPQSGSSKRNTPSRPPSISRSAQKSPHKVSSIFQRDPSTGVSTPRVLLTPQRRRLSGVGADRSGLGSPKVAETLDRRESIGDSASKFIPGKTARGVTFGDAEIIEQEFERERQEEEDHQHSEHHLDKETNAGDDENSTATLKDMIASLSPKKKTNPLKGRKSLAIGSGRGLLGKRPVELDEEDDEEEARDGVKRLKGHQGSPVKNVHLHAPPSKAETTGRITRAARKSLEQASGNIGSPSRPSPRKTFGDIENDQPTDTFNFRDESRLVESTLPQDDQGQRIHLQDFLDMTSIRFMELTTTKRRHTEAPSALRDSLLSSKEDISLERCVVAGACTVPMLELYQHSCRELKKYISEGRRIVREIETETFEENPPLFREYMSATPDFKILMDNQFKNVKTHARLLSKAMWYEWRMKLQEGLKEGLVKIAEGMEADERLLQKEENLIKPVLPNLEQRFRDLESKQENLQSVARELADCDPEDLEAARAELVETDSAIEAKLHKIEELHQALVETEATVGDMVERKQECVAAIDAAEKIREECRGWTSNEINSLKAKVAALEDKHGWNITGIADTTMSMTYRREIELVFDIAMLQNTKPDSRIDLWYIAANRETNTQPATPEKEFFVQCIRDHVRSLAPPHATVSTLLRVVSAGWQKAVAVADDIRLLNCTFPTEVVRTGDSSIAVKAQLLLAPLQTKVQVILGLHAQNTASGVEIIISPKAHVVYGENFKVDKMDEFLSTRLGDKVVTKAENDSIESWSDVIVELHERLMARGRKSA